MLEVWSANESSRGRETYHVKNILDNKTWHESQYPMGYDCHGISQGQSHVEIPTAVLLIAI